MDKRDLLRLALANAISESVNTYPNKMVYLFGDIKNEFTVVSEDNVDRVLAVEPDLKLVCKILNGKFIKEE